MTALQESDAATSLLLNALLSNRRRIASATAAPSMIAPSTMLSGGIGSLANAATLYDLPTALSSTALTALDPISRPTTSLDLPRPNTAAPHPQTEYQSRFVVNRRKIADCSRKLRSRSRMAACVRLRIRYAITKAQLATHCDFVFTYRRGASSASQGPERTRRIGVTVL